MTQDQSGGPNTPSPSDNAQSPQHAANASLGPSVALSGASDRDLSGSYKWFALGILFLVYVFNFVDRQIFAILQEEIRKDLNLSDTQLGFLGGFAFAIFYTTLGLPIARLADRSNRSRIIAAALAVWSSMTALCGLASGFFTLALARIGVGVGEAGCTPPAHSLIADYFPQEKRSTALGIYSMGVPIGVAMGFLFGGYINEWLGWREAFLLVGLPGLVFSLFVFLFLKEPIRGRFDGAGNSASTRAQAPAQPLPMGQVINTLMTLKTFRHLAIAASLHAFVAYGVGHWMPSFFIRNWGISTGELSLAFGLIFLTAGAVSVFLGGWLSDRFAAYDKRWYCWVPALSILAALPASLLVLFQANWLMAAFFVGVAALFNGMYLGPTFSMLQGLVSAKMRALASAVMLFVMNLIGLGLGPLIVGIMSDGLRGSFGDDSLKFALLGMSVLNGWAAIHYFIGARTLREETAAAAAAAEAEAAEPTAQTA